MIYLDKIHAGFVTCGTRCNPSAAAFVLSCDSVARAACPSAEFVSALRVAVLTFVGACDCNEEIVLAVGHQRVVNLTLVAVIHENSPAA